MFEKRRIVADLDGTLADTRDRIHLITTPHEPRRWNDFHSAGTDAPVLHEAAQVVRLFGAEGYEVNICTGRNERFRVPTIGWFNKHRIPWDNLLMRPDEDFRPDHELKPELLLKKELTPDSVLFILEDRGRMVDEWRKLGYICFQVARGAY